MARQPATSNDDVREVSAILRYPAGKRWLKRYLSPCFHGLSPFKKDQSKIEPFFYPRRFHCSRGGVPMAP
jgi:hypothetical protein